jgi:hypothetical protein
MWRPLARLRCPAWRTIRAGSRRSAAAQIGKVSRQGCREVFEKRFTSEVMAANYERVYYRLIDERRNAAAVTGRLKGRWTQRCETGES